MYIMLYGQDSRGPFLKFAYRLASRHGLVPRSQYAVVEARTRGSYYNVSQIAACYSVSRSV
jgi:hypothetical protein